MPRQEQVEIDGQIQTVEFPDNYTDLQVEQSMQQFIGGEVGRQEDVPSLPPTGAAFKETEPKGFMERLGEDAPAMIGGIAGPLATASKAAQMSRPAAVALQTGSAALFGAAGEAYHQLYQWANDSKDAPGSSMEAASRLAETGAEQGLYEIGGQAAIKALKTMAKPLLPTVKESTKALGREFGVYEGAFTLPQMTESKLISTLGGLTEKSFLGSFFFKRAAEKNRLALNTMSNDLATQVAKSAGALGDKQLGQLFLDTAKGGRVAHSSVANNMYSHLDNLVGEREIKSTVTTMRNTGLITPQGSPIERAVEETAVKLADNAPVDMRGMKVKAVDMLERMKRSGTIGGNESKEILATISSRPDKMLFGDANALRSDLLTVVREMEDKLGAGKAKKIAGDFSRLATEAMDTAAANAKDPAIAEAYKSANKFWAHGKEIFDNDFVGGLIVANKKNPERLGETIFRDGNVTEILQAKKAVRAAAKLDKSIDADDVWRKMQAGYLNGILAKSTKAGDEMVDHGALSKMFLDPKKSRTLGIVFDKSQRKTISAFRDIAKRIEQKPESNLGMVVQLTQAGAILDLATLRMNDPKTDVAVVFTPAIVASMLTNPKTSKLLVQSMVTRSDTTLGKQLFTKLSAEAGKLVLEDQETEQRQQ